MYKHMYVSIYVSRDNVLINGERNLLLKIEDIGTKVVYFIYTQYQFVN